MSQARAVQAEASGLDGLSLQQRMELQYEIEQFLYAEAAMIDAREYRAWLDLWTEDCSYWMPIRRTVTLSDIDKEFTKRGDMSFFDDDKKALAMRVTKMESGSSWSEDPPSRTRHFVNNVRVVALEGSEITVELAFSLYRTRLNTEESMWAGRRVDRLRRVNGALKLCGRDIYLEQTLIRATNMSTLF
ncbi:aromatic-ring-hydroxylating dioxygenase subunit beta [Parvibaculum sp.]|uniref:aromatic-ring-hydroxylating dioxygenase subunit beta n=1 Tax=Parvibaculum sp. TaxID=2024848 RepID=UPI0027301B22|nr:aromatic-ring-hydroxylating dioxygenase subunit beta [Parvibaculum sp.]MDP1627980.1 aromatic-ring-hydroxylating dioxygenase subunit beta [Parvibaculum sp.]MDP2150979.1 aromatic-ring-hydroxylating dioxygenase subunit beta [Parvibaculum sp.]MDP3327494.1 aromatic-ring-hydroxylating dioxygenase subunit beta [Parvibaculum sp.]